MRGGSVFQDRTQAGRLLAEKLTRFDGARSVVLAIPRGGVPVSVEIAQKLNANLDVIVVRKVAVPRDPESGYGAITDDGTLVQNERMVARLGLTQQQIDEGVDEVKQEIARRALLYRGNRPFPHLVGKAAILIDDGLASGFTMIAAIKSARRHGARKVIVAAPCASRSAVDRIKPICDELICLIVSDASSFAVASFYRDWYDLSDEEVINILKQRWEEETTERNSLNNDGY
jgi:putative phosphoribosyl transferase